MKKGYLETNKREKSVFLLYFSLSESLEFYLRIQSYEKNEKFKT